MISRFRVHIYKFKQIIACKPNFLQKKEIIFKTFIVYWLKPKIALNQGQKNVYFANVCVNALVS